MKSKKIMHYKDIGKELGLSRLSETKYSDLIADIDVNLIIFDQFIENERSHPRQEMEKARSKKFS